MLVKVTKHREKREDRALEPCWRIHLDGVRSALFIEKAWERPKWGQGQEYDLCHDRTGFITDGSVYSLLKTVDAIVNATHATKEAT